MSAPDTDGLRSPARVMSSPPIMNDTSLRPSSANRISSNNFHVLSPSDIVGPSPVTSNGTETTEIEDDVAEDIEQSQSADVDADLRSETLSITTDLPDEVRQTGEESGSVIHAPESFASWKSNAPAPPVGIQRRSPEPMSPRADATSLASLDSSLHKVRKRITKYLAYII
jgi:hypothetical protein